MPAAILTYHPIHVVENTYEGSDLVALERDLATIERLGIPVRPLHELFPPPGTDPRSPPGIADVGPCVAITFDDGSVFDYVDHDHPTCGRQRSAATILREAARTHRTLAAARPLAATFVIASPAARAELDRKDYGGGNYWPDDWWAQAAASGVLSVESHSWDHNHASLERSVQRDNVRGTFRNIETWDEAEAEIARSLDYIAARSGVRPRFFAYPWGEASDYLAREYLPRRGPALGLHAALSGPDKARGFATRASDRWLVPRLICGSDWKAPGELEALLRALRAAR